MSACNAGHRTKYRVGELVGLPLAEQFRACSKIAPARLGLARHLQAPCLAGVTGVGAALFLKLADEAPKFVRHKRPPIKPPDCPLTRRFQPAVLGGSPRISVGKRASISPNSTTAALKANASRFSAVVFRVVIPSELLALWQPGRGNELFFTRRQLRAGAAGVSHSGNPQP